MASSIIDSRIFQGIFSSDAMRQVWSDENRTQKYLDIERALAVVQGRLGLIPQEAADEIARHCTLDQIDLIEINEAFGAQVMACSRELGLDEANLNPHGGAIAIGHPLGATGIRLAVTCARGLARRGGRYGIASACIGGGQGIALLLEVAR